jgi:hypothetical protein
LEKSGNVKPTKDGKGYELTPKGKEWVERRRSEENVIREKRGQKPKLSPEQRQKKEEASESGKVTSPEEIGAMLAAEQKKLDEKRKAQGGKTLGERMRTIAQESSTAASETTEAPGEKRKSIARKIREVQRKMDALRDDPDRDRKRRRMLPGLRKLEKRYRAEAEREFGEK